jgi:hypothetical protein
MLRREFLSTALIPVLVGPTNSQTDPWKAEELLEPDTFATQLKSNPVPPILYVGFPILYKGAHIQGALLAGPCSKPEGWPLSTRSQDSFIATARSFCTAVVVR